MSNTDQNAVPSMTTEDERTTTETVMKDEERTTTGVITIETTPRTMTNEETTDGT